MSIAKALDMIGSTQNLVAATAAPTLATDGYATKGHRFVNLWVSCSGGTSVDVSVYVYRQFMGWMLYTDVPTTTLLTANGGGLLQLELRGCERVYLRHNSFNGGVTSSIVAEAVTYGA